MYFKEKGNTNIDSEFEKNKKISFNINFKKPKLMLFVGGGLILLLILIFVVLTILNSGSKYTIELYGDKEISLYLGSDYIEPGYIAFDKNKSNVTNEVQITSNLDINKIGEYEILYSIDGINKVRYIKVIENNPDTHIRLNGENPMYLKLGQKYIEPGYEVYDSIDSNLKVKITGTVDTSKKGTYRITYSVTNRANVTVTKTRTVVVE